MTRFDVIGEGIMIIQQKTERNSKEIQKKDENRYSRE